MRNVIAASLVLCALGVASTSASNPVIVVEEPLLISVLEEAGTVKLAFFTPDRTIPNRLLPTKVRMLEILREDRRQQVWAIIVPSASSGIPGSGAWEVVYGQPPAGFRQYRPPAGVPAPPLEPGVTYRIGAAAGPIGTTTFTYKGQ